MSSTIQRFRIAVFVVIAMSSLATPASAAPVTTYFGLDIGAGPADPRPNSAAAAASFLSATASTSLITFEQFASDLPNSSMNIHDVPGALAISPTVSLSSSLAELGGTSIGSPGSRSGLSTSSPSFIGPSAGYNTTPGGQVFLFMDTPGDALTGIFGGYWLYTFSSPINAFGAYITGWQSDQFNSLYFEFNDGSAQSLTFSGDTTNSALFFGFTDPSAAISSVIVRQDGPSLWSMDDIYFGVAVPEPSSLLLGLFAIAGLAAVAIRNRLARKSLSP